MAEDTPQVIVALDFPDPKAALALADRLEPGRCRLKVGKELFTRGGPQLVGDLRDRGYDIFLDLKFHDIPNTVARACSAAADLGVWMVNVHALGGRRMMEAAAEALAQSSQPPLLLAVTILTSLGEADLAEVGIHGSAEENVRRLAALAEASGVGGVVCSPREVSSLRSERGEGFRLVTPGIRPRWAAKDDQVRVTTPGEAVAAGADYLVIGRPITGAEDPLAALAGIEAELA